MSLNPAQRAAVDHCDTPLLVLAGAGSGKTRVITQKIQHLIVNRRMPAEKIAAITFTNKAAREMRERAGALLRGVDSEGLTICTFHSLGLKFLQIEHEAARLRRGFSIFDSDDAGALVKDLMPRGASGPDIAAIRALISRAKSDGLSPERAAELAKSPREREAADIYGQYQKRLAAFNAVDFDDLIRLPVQMLEEHEALRETWRERLRYLLVDEYQDTNATQYALLKHLAGPRGAFTCVGDDDQSIYAWRGADTANIERLGQDYPQLRIVKLEQNYRCARRILRAANALIANNPHLHPKRLWSDHPDGEPIRVFECRDNEHEAERVASEIAFLAHKHKAEWSDFSILFRGNHQSRALEKALQLQRIPYHLSGGTAFLERAEVKDALAWLRLIANPDDDAAFLRTANALDGFMRLMAGLRRAAAVMSPGDLCRKLVEESGQLAAIRAECKDEAMFDRRRGNVEELAEWFNAAGKGGKGGPGELVAQLALLTASDRDSPGNAVRLMTLHASKGLEFDFVFIVGVEDGLLPHESSVEEGRIDEERRLMYVGITRAKRLLHLSYPRHARRFGEVARVTPSRFLDELPAAEVHYVGRDAEQDAERTQEHAGAAIARLKALFGE